ncbi:ankyrin repeat domain-containing protein SOWAHC-like [Salarias fasciatus]|uniref:ankyrin repeat domain-containing protein SOWAHC-like n=1 Tax=Salarias fasciatus TaxID=181472 RepID=UPI00117676FE|nr:ankyrin repeat domain-containing protein SOWAHC-like [Salarias fasciatus]
MEFSRDVLVDFLLRGGGRVSHAALLEHFKPLFPEDPRGRASVRDSFKKCVDSVAVVRTEDGVRYVCLKRRFQPPGREDRAGTGPGDSFRGQTAAGTSTSSGDDAAAPGSHSGSDVQVCVPHVSTCVSEGVCEERRGSGDMGNRGSFRHSDRGSRKELVPVRKNIPAIEVIQASPPPSAGPVFLLPGPAPPQGSGCRWGAGDEARLDQLDQLDQLDHLDEDSPRGSRRHFLQTMVSSSPEVRRSVVLRSWDPDAAGDAVSLASSLEDERAAVTLDPLEHEWMLCASDGEWPCLQRLLEAEPGLVLKRDFVTGFTCLHWAAKLGRPELLALIVNFARQRAVPVDVDVRSSAGYTPLHVAAMHHHLEVVKLLVGAYGADVEARDHGGRKACQYLRDGVSGDIRDIVGASHGAADPPRAVPDHGGRWRLSRALQANPRPPGDPADGEQPPLRRRASLSKLQKLRSRTSQLVHSTTFHGPGDLPASWRGSFRLRPKTHFFG